MMLTQSYHFLLPLRSIAVEASKTSKQLSSILLEVDTLQHVACQISFCFDFFEYFEFDQKRLRGDDEKKGSLFFFYKYRPYIIFKWLLKEWAKSTAASQLLYVRSYS